MSLRHVSLAAFLCTLTASCKTNRPALPENGPDGVGFGLVLEPPADSGTCDVLEFECEATGTMDPTLCVSENYGTENKMRFFRHFSLKGWGNGECQAKRSLLREACLRGYDLKMIPNDDIFCVPDPSSGECPVVAAECPTSGDDVQTTCLVNRYDGQEVASDSDFAMRAWGKNECHARQNLRALACDLQLKPSLIAGDAIECMPSTTAEHPDTVDCPIGAKLCPLEFDPAQCTVYEQIGPDGQAIEMDYPIEAYGNNGCEARADVQLIACRRNIGPSTLGEIQCR